MSEVDKQGGDPEIGICHVCGRSFGTQAELSEHLLDAHGNGEEGSGAASS